MATKKNATAPTVPAETAPKFLTVAQLTADAVKGLTRSQAAWYVDALGYELATDIDSRDYLVECVADIGDVATADADIVRKVHQEGLPPERPVLKSPGQTFKKLGGQVSALLEGCDVLEEWIDASNMTLGELSAWLEENLEVAQRLDDILKTVPEARRKELGVSKMSVANKFRFVFKELAARARAKTIGTQAAPGEANPDHVAPQTVANATVSTEKRPTTDASKGKGSK